MNVRQLISVLIMAAVAGCAGASIPGASSLPKLTSNAPSQTVDPPSPTIVVPSPSSGCGRPRCPTFVPPPVATPGPLFDGTIHGWRIATTDVLEGEGLARNLVAECEPRRYGRNHETDLDFPAGYLPTGARSEGVEKWACGRAGFSVSEAFSFEAYPGSGVGVYRAIWGSMSADLSVPADAVRACEVRGFPAICVDESFQGYVDRGLDHIIVIEDGTLDPDAVVLRLSGDELPFAELMKMAEELAGLYEAAQRTAD